MSWLDHAKERSVADVARELGYEVRRHASSSSSKCPLCGAERRHTRSGDKRGAVGMPHGKPQAWRCFQADCGGDAIDFAACHIGGARYRDLSDERKDEVKAFFGFADDRRVFLPARAMAKPKPLPVEHENAFRNYPYRGEVDALWALCRPVTDDAEAAGYLRWRGIDRLVALVEHDCVRVLPSHVDCPAWAHFGTRPWSTTGHRLLVPLYDSLGRMRSFVARSVEYAPLRKSLGAKEHERAGLVMAGSFGREVLLTGALAHWHRMTRLRVSVFEGEVDVLRAVALGEDAEVSEDWQVSGYRAVFGIFAGSWQRDIAARIPSGSTIVLATDDDASGDKYADEIRERIGERCDYDRVRVPQDRPAA